MEDEAIRAAQEKTLGKLNWLIGRTKMDFKGNPSPVAKAKTKQSVEKQKKEHDKHLQGGNFTPFGHQPVPLAMDATRVASHDTPEVASELPSDHHIRNKYHQVLDKNSQRPIIYGNMQPLHASLERSPVRGKRRYPNSASSNAIEANVFTRPSARDIQLATAQERLQLLRADALQHPMFTNNSRFVHSCDHWDPTSQLGTNPVLVAPQKYRAPLMQRRNEVRMVGVLRRTGGAPTWK
ncbi:unnamed protein product [Bodo saltans]|uniref:Uncharacterized protein n=1 Tax=Bodo saltans TaxID=75058 RepID=A0A0S4J706_BODSA|nr:unnamed protein product [Bodo saltans]|eukprot:CUG85674.1 unnamed protein product [Bodo saltans]